MVRKERASRCYGGALAEKPCVGESGFQPMPKLFPFRGRRIKIDRFLILHEAVEKDTDGPSPFFIHVSEQF
jgi:hypothetical protein